MTERHRAPRKIDRVEIPITPVTVSERTCEATFGIAPWRLRQLAADHGIGRRLGQSIVVPVADVLRALGLDGEPHVQEEVGAIGGVDQILRSIGRRRT